MKYLFASTDELKINSRHSLYSQQQHCFTHIRLVNSITTRTGVTSTIERIAQDEATSKLDNVSLIFTSLNCS